MEEGRAIAEGRRRDRKGGGGRERKRVERLREERGKEQGRKKAHSGRREKGREKREERTAGRRMT